MTSQRYTIGEYRGVSWRHARLCDVLHGDKGRRWYYWVRQPGHPLHDNGYATLGALAEAVDALYQQEVFGR